MWQYTRMVSLFSITKIGKQLDLVPSSVERCVLVNESMDLTGN